MYRRIRAVGDSLRLETSGLMAVVLKVGYNRMYGYCGNGFHALSLINKSSKNKNPIRLGLGTLGQTLTGVRGLICIQLGVFDVKKFDNHWFMGYVVLL